jgi:ABC-type transport system substrate-binding protein
MPARLLVLLALLAALTSTLGASASTRQAASGPTYGGTLSIAYAGGFSSMDPAQSISYDWYMLNGALFNGLYQFDRNGQPQLDLAAAPPTISADRKTWTFTLKKGVLFGNGMEVTAEDMAFSLLRTLDPHLKPAVSWGQPTDEIFQGSPEYVAGKTKTVPGIQVLGRYTIRFTLLNPTANLPDILAETFNMVVPKAVVTKETPAYFADHPVGTGPFTLQSYQKGVKAVFVRNPHYFHKGKPYLDKVIVELAVNANLIALRVEKGQLDGFGLPADEAAADIQHARADPKYSHYLVNTPETAVNWLDLNVHEPPLDNLKLRQAIAMAINRTRQVQVNGGLVAPANQIYIPLMPQYDPTLDQHPIYPYDPQKAAALVKASGYHNQPITFLYDNDTSSAVNSAQAVQQDLQQIGLNVVLKGVASAGWTQEEPKLTGHHIDLSGWGIDYPDAFDTYSSKFTCAVNVAGGMAGAHYCDPAADALVTQGQALPLGPARNAQFRQAQARILRAASTVPLSYILSPLLVRPGIGGFYFQPTFGWQFENYWIQH